MKKLATIEINTIFGAGVGGKAECDCTQLGSTGMNNVHRISMQDEDHSTKSTVTDYVVYYQDTCKAYEKFLSTTTGDYVFCSLNVDRVSKIT